MDKRQLGPFLVSPIRFGAMRLAGPNVFGPPRSPREALAVLREAADRYVVLRRGGRSGWLTVEV